MVGNGLSRTNKIRGYATYASFPTTGQTGVWYFDLDTGLPYIWDGTAYQDLDPEADEKFEAMLEPTGFPLDPATGEIERDDSELSWTNGTNTFTIQPKAPATSFNIYIHGTKFTYSSAQTKVITPAQGVWYFYFDTSGVLQATQTFSFALFSLGYVAYGYYDATSANDMLFGDIFDERHGCGMDSATHARRHSDTGMQFDSGLALNTIAVDQDGSLDAHAQFGIDAGVTYDEDIRFDIDAVGSTTGLPIIYHDASGKWISTTQAGFAVKTTGTGRLAYNPSGSALVEVTDGRYVLCHVFATAGDGSDKKGRLVSIVGQNQYLNVVQAREGATLEINNLILGGLPTEEFKFFATVIFQTLDAYTNSINARVRSTDLGDDYEDFRFSGITASGAGVTSHSNLAGLGNDDHQQYALLVGRINDVLNLPGSGDLSILGTDTSAATPRVSMKTNNSGYATPSAANADSNGDKYVFWNSAAFKGAIGMNANEMWFQAMGSAGSDRFRFYTGDATTPAEVCRFGETLIIFNESRTDRDFKIGKITSGYAYVYDFGDGSHTYIGDVIMANNLTVGASDEDGVFELKNASAVTKTKFNPVGSGYNIGGDFIFASDGEMTPSTLVEVETATDEGDAGLTIDQNDADEPFINFEGTSAADQTNNISTVNGDGAVSGPQLFSSSAGWVYAGMTRQNINGTDYWMPYYSAQTS